MYIFLSKPKELTEKPLRLILKVLIIYIYVLYMYILIIFVYDNCYKYFIFIYTSFKLVIKLL